MSNIYPELKSDFLACVSDGVIPATIFLTNGVKLSGTITRYNSECIVLSREGISQLVFLNAVATVMPQEGIDLDVVLPVYNPQ